jgi:hypothetical protein
VEAAEKITEGQGALCGWRCPLEEFADAVTW